MFMDDLLLHQPDMAGDEGEEDVRFWLWDMSTVEIFFAEACLVLLIKISAFFGSRRHTSNLSVIEGAHCLMKGG